MLRAYLGRIVEEKRIRSAGLVSPQSRMRTRATGTGPMPVWIARSGLNRAGFPGDCLVWVRRPRLSQAAAALGGNRALRNPVGHVRRYNQPKP